ncbi:hypothetical protein [Asanoa siamensis]|uniref:Regulator of septum formation n=1 Tax=Asanoa siamensis TaxID=926357 RepID=A0ABQ4D301_9ACTN|nr:hypothetical protein [Asanoa siamensis]GIF77911.1 hypothetical protein Asi02nite_74290 [Asanoa siamensis]
MEPKDWIMYVCGGASLAATVAALLTARARRISIICAVVLFICAGAAGLLLRSRTGSEPPQVGASRAAPSDPLIAASVGDCVKPGSIDPDAMVPTPCGEAPFTIVKRVPLDFDTAAIAAQRDAKSERHCAGVANSDQWTWIHGTDGNGAEQLIAFCLKAR